MKSCKNCKHFGWKHPSSQLEDVCINCYHKQDGVPSNWEHEATTRADRIRAMSDEELAAYWYDHHDDFCPNQPECREMLNHDQEIPAEKCVGCVLRWLQEEV